jgi:isopentenyl-diphosphate delta-isomerase
MDEENSAATSSRKDDHIQICLEKDVVYDTIPHGFDSLKLEPTLLVNLSPADVILESSLFGKTIDYPLIISGMTGGSLKGQRFNEIIAEVCRELNIGMGVGSQRAAIENSDLVSTYVVRHKAPEIPLLANLGIAQFLNGYGNKEIEEAIQMIEADAIAIHLNPLQEFTQKEGNKVLFNTKEKISEIIKECSYPIIIKGVGRGISKIDAKFLTKQNIYAIDVAGAGGTNWVKIETYRNPKLSKLSQEFINWGIPTALSLMNVVEETKDKETKIIASGGIWNGLDATKALLLGADYVAFALPVLKSIAKGGIEELRNYLYSYTFELKTTFAMLGIRNFQELKEARKKILGIGQ